MQFPTEKCTFLQKNAFSCRKNANSCRKMRFLAGSRRKLQEGFRAQESRTLANFHKQISVWISGARSWKPSCRYVFSTFFAIESPNTLSEIGHGSCSMQFWKIFFGECCGQLKVFGWPCRAPWGKITEVQATRHLCFQTQKFHLWWGAPLTCWSKTDMES